MKDKETAAGKADTLIRVNGHIRNDTIPLPPHTQNYEEERL
jgi:hypothetical protein